MYTCSSSGGQIIKLICDIVPLFFLSSECRFHLPSHSKPKHPEKTKARIAIYSAGEIWGFEAARAVLIHIIAERWRHAPTKVTPQVLKSSIAVFFPSPSCLSFISSPPVLVCIHLPCLFICTVSLLITSSFHLLSNDL